MDNTLWPASCPTCSRYEERSHKSYPFQDLNSLWTGAPVQNLFKYCSDTVLILFSCSKTAQIMFNCSNTAQIMSNTVLIGSAGPRQDYNSFWTGFGQELLSINVQILERTVFVGSFLISWAGRTGGWSQCVVH